MHAPPCPAHPPLHSGIILEVNLVFCSSCLDREEYSASILNVSETFHSPHSNKCNAHVTPRMLIKTQFGNRPTISDQLFSSLFCTEMGRFQLQAPPAALSVIFSPLLLILTGALQRHSLRCGAPIGLLRHLPPDDRELVSGSSVPSEAGTQKCSIRIC